jgi:hypothetical protein
MVGLSYNIKNSQGMPPTEYLARHGFLHELVAAHCCCMTLWKRGKRGFGGTVNNRKEATN